MEFLLGLGVVGIVILGLITGGIIWGVGNAAGWGKSKQKKALKAAEQPRPYAYLDTTEGATVESVTKVARGYESNEALGSRAQAVIRTFERSELLRQDILSILERQFQKGSLTWDKFSAPLDVALEGILNNGAQITNRMQAFDAAEYLRLDRIDHAGGLEGKDTEVERLQVMRASLAEMDSIQGSSDRLVLELEKLQAELNKLSGEDAGTSTDQIAEEIHNLVEETHYYA